jgi:hypothetical protein
MKARKRQVATTLTAVLFLLLLATSALVGQGQEVRTNPPPPPRPTQDPSDRMGESPWPSKPGMVTPKMPSSAIEIKSSMADLKVNIDLIRTIDEELLGIMGSPSPSYATIATDASDIRRLAVRLLRNLALPRAQTQSQDPGATASAEQLNDSINSLDSAVQSFLRSPVLTQPHIVDAELLSDAGADLEKIVTRSSNVQERAVRMATSGDDARRGKPARANATVRSRLKPKTSIQLTLECDAWSVTELLAKPSEIKGQGSVNVGIDVQTKNHRLAEQLILPIEDCVDGEADEDATAKSMQYVVIARDFTSYEIKRKVFAYRVIYEIGLTKNGQIAKRLPLPVWFYYVDEAGDGTFELLRSSTRTGFLPDWVRDLAKKH